MDFLKTDKPWFGFVFALIVPVIGFVLLSEINDYIKLHSITFYGGFFTKKFIYILSVFFNILPFLVAKRQRLDHQLQGIVGATLLLAMAVLIYFLKIYGF
jgi:hypothetical protein